ncbi:PREDICTED: protein NEN1-like [Ipomoea nil]|uniref:protein NEN1-like n=1 Tax=Ipomoea nil TaxID=35883 RepID=UPI000901EA49|nr:PREDICTED: protein NEN1-like [Ipomoea nil]
MVLTGDRSEIVFFDLETTTPTRPGQGHAILEFGAILVCPRKLVELENYCTLVRPADPSLMSNLSVRSNGICRDAVASAPTFADIADKVYDILDGRIWAGHNILKFDCPRIREAFAGINRPAPEPKGTIDSLALLTQRFGRRAGDMKMASLATYFGLGQQKHRSLDDVRMNLEVLKYCSTVLLLESSLPDIFTEKSWVSPNAITRSRSKASPGSTGSSATNPSTNLKIENQIHSVKNDTVEDVIESSSAMPDPFNMAKLLDEIERESHQSEGDMDDNDDDDDDDDDEYCPSDESSTEIECEVPRGGCTGFLELNEISIPYLSVTLVPFYRGMQKIKVFHDCAELQVCCRRLKVRFGVSKKYFDYAGRPQLNIVVNATPNLCKILDEINGRAQRLCVESGSSSEWRPIVSRNPGYENFPTVRFQLAGIVNGEIVCWATEIYEQEIGSGRARQVVSSRFDNNAELDGLVRGGCFVDVYFSLDAYDYQGRAGIRLVVKKLILHRN